MAKPKLQIGDVIRDERFSTAGASYIGIVTYADSDYAEAILLYTYKNEFRRVSVEHSFNLTDPQTNISVLVPAVPAAPVEEDESQGRLISETELEEMRREASEASPEGKL